MSEIVVIRGSSVLILFRRKRQKFKIQPTRYFLLVGFHKWSEFNTFIVGWTINFVFMYFKDISSYLESRLLKFI